MFELKTRHRIGIPNKAFKSQNNNVVIILKFRDGRLYLKFEFQNTRPNLKILPSESEVRFHEMNIQNEFKISDKEKIKRIFNKSFLARDWIYIFEERSIISKRILLIFSHKIVLIRATEFH